jgi:hypothetical protein
MRAETEYQQTRSAYGFRVRKLMRRFPIIVAEAIGFVVAEIRLHVVPKIRKLYQLVINKGKSDRKDPLLSCMQVNSPAEDYRHIKTRVVRNAVSSKKYNYKWAHTRMSELAHQGVSDPVSYFNNEMTDWWLAPEGMMEQEADFEGIALAIEERWYS